MDPFTSKLAAEWTLLRASCARDLSAEDLERVRMILRSSIQWPTLFELADRHGLQPLLFDLLSHVEELTPTEEMDKLRRYCRSNVHRALFLSRELIRVVDALSSVGVQVLPYKGLALAESVYGDIALRQAGDIDVLIRGDDLPKAKPILKELSYESKATLSVAQQVAYLRSGYEFSFDSALGRNLLEVQWAIQPRFYAVDYAMDLIFERSVTIEVAGHSMKTPSPEDLFIILSLHAAKHVWGRLIWLCDISRVAASPSLDWTWIGLQAMRLGIVRILRVTLRMTEKLFNITVPEEAECALPKDEASVQLADEILAQIADGKVYDVESMAYFRLMVLLRERPMDRMRFVSRLALTPGPSEWAAVRIPQALFPLYRVVRVLRLAGKLVRA
jgi:hypothetical protein